MRYPDKDRTGFVKASTYYADMRARQAQSVTDELVEFHAIVASATVMELLQLVGKFDRVADLFETKRDTMSHAQYWESHARLSAMRTIVLEGYIYARTVAA